MHTFLFDVYILRDVLRGDNCNFPWTDPRTWISGTIFYGDSTPDISLKALPLTLTVTNSVALDLNNQHATTKVRKDVSLRNKSLRRATLFVTLADLKKRATIPLHCQSNLRPASVTYRAANSNCWRWIVSSIQNVE